MKDYLRSYTTRCFDETDIFPGHFIKKFEDNANKAHKIPREVENNTKRMAM